ncbi:MAG TPA: hypothetical protein VGD91_14085, partial [Trebonia sp.]
ASIVTLETGGAVTLRAVTAGPSGRLAAYRWNASAGWYDPAGPSATFLVLTAGRFVPPASSGLSARAAVSAFGRPARTEHYRGYLILVWPRGENLLARLKSGQSAPAAVPNG